MALNQLYDPALLPWVPRDQNDVRDGKRIDLIPAPSRSIIDLVLSAVAQSVVSYRAECARQALVEELRSLPAYLLRDVGIDPHDIRRAIDARFWPTRK